MHTAPVSHNEIVVQMINLSNNKGFFRLHPDVIPEGVEESYMEFVGEPIVKRELDGGGVFQVGEAKFYYGRVITHPSLRAAMLIAA